MRSYKTSISWWKKFSDEKSNNRYYLRRWKILGCISPYDALWKTEAYSANIYKDGKIIYNGDFKEYTWIRTGLLTPLIIHTLEIDLTKKKILIVGSWKLAKNAVKALIVLNPNITEIFYTSFSWRKKEFEENFQKELFQLTYKEVPIYNDYDFIGLYTNTSTPILSSITY